MRTASRFVYSGTSFVLEVTDTLLHACDGTWRYRSGRVARGQDGAGVVLRSIVTRKQKQTKLTEAAASKISRMMIRNKFSKRQKFVD